MGTARTTIRIDADLLREAKIRAAQEGTSVTRLIERGLRREIAQPEPASEPFVLPVSENRGGVVDPGFDPTWSLGKMLGYLDELEARERRG